MNLKNTNERLKEIEDHFETVTEEEFDKKLKAAGYGIIESSGSDQMGNSIEEAGLSIGLYNKLKRKGINDVRNIPKLDYSKFTKADLIELLNNYGVFNY